MQLLLQGFSLYPVFKELYPLPTEEDFKKAKRILPT